MARLHLSRAGGVLFFGSRSSPCLPPAPAPPTLSDRLSPILALLQSTATKTEKNGLILFIISQFFLQIESVNSKASTPGPSVLLLLNNKKVSDRVPVDGNAGSSCPFQCYEKDRSGRHLRAIEKERIKVIGDAFEGKRVKTGFSDYQDHLDGKEGSDWRNTALN